MRLHPNIRAAQILDAAMDCAVKHGYTKFTRSDVARKIKVADGLINNYYQTMDHLRRAVMRRAIDNKVLIIIAQGLAAGDRIAAKAPLELKKQALASLT